MVDGVRQTFQLSTTIATATDVVTALSGLVNATAAVVSGNIKITSLSKGSVRRNDLERSRDPHFNVLRKYLLQLSFDGTNIFITLVPKAYLNVG